MLPTFYSLIKLKLHSKVTVAIVRYYKLSYEERYEAL